MPLHSKATDIIIQTIFEPSGEIVITIEDNDIGFKQVGENNSGIAWTGGLWPFAANGYLSRKM